MIYERSCLTFVAFALSLLKRRSETGEMEGSDFQGGNTEAHEASLEQTHARWT